MLLTPLVPNRQYFYRVRSGSLSYPQAADADNVFFVTEAGVGSDFDQDGDVDQSDFGRLQACLTGPGMAQNDPACAPARLDDEDVDRDDTAILQGCMSGPNVPAGPDCAD